MRISSYLIGGQIPKQPFYVIMHGYTGAVDKLPAWLGAPLVANRGKLLAEMSEAEHLPESVLDVLRARGYLTPLTHEDERRILLRIAASLHERDLLNSPSGFMLVPTYTCNLRCPYCFQPHEMHAGKGRFAELLSREQVDEAFHIIDQFDHSGAIPASLGVVDPCNRNDSVRFEAEYEGKIGLFGGEPLCAPTLEIVSYILEQANQRGKSLSAITNGVELNLFEHLLGPGKIEKLQITLDGSKEYHDQRRIGPGYRETFDRIVRNIEMALDSGVSISTRLNIDTQNIHGVEELSQLFQERGWNRRAGFWAYAAAVHQERQAQAPVTRTDLVQITMQPAVPEHARYHIKSYEKTADETLGACLDGNGYPFRRSVFCAAETGLLIFDPLGDVYACWEEIGDREYRIATYDREGLHWQEVIAKNWLMRFPGNIEECSNCPYALIHTSGCASHARKQSGTIFSSACESFKEYFPLTLGNSYSRFENGILGRGVESHRPFALEPQVVEVGS